MTMSNKVTAIRRSGTSASKPCWQSFGNGRLTRAVGRVAKPLGMGRQLEGSLNSDDDEQQSDIDQEEWDISIKALLAVR